MKQSIGENIVGTWKLVSWVYENDRHETVHYFGENATGILMYNQEGYMNAQLMKSGRKPFTTDSISGGTPGETFDAFNSYLAYFGKYYEEKPGEIVHIVEGSLFPNWVGKKEVRYGSIENDRLILSTPPIQAGEKKIIFYITWQRIKGERLNDMKNIIV
jgi:hypothetical protein